MTPWVKTLIPDEDIQLFEIIKDILPKIPDMNCGYINRRQNHPISCHMLACAIGRKFDLEIIHGTFLVEFQHSWVLTPNKNIIDLYPVGILNGPLLVTSISTGPAKCLYRSPAPPDCYDEDFFTNKRFISAVEKISTYL